MFRTIVAVAVGWFVGSLFNASLVFLNMALYPVPESFDWDDTSGVKAHFETLPVMAFTIVLIAHLGQAFIGGYVAARISKNQVLAVAMIVGGISLIGGIMNTIMLPLPNWMLIEMPLYLVVSYCAGVLELKRRARRVAA